MTEPSSAPIPDADETAGNTAAVPMAVGPTDGDTPAIGRTERDVQELSGRFDPSIEALPVYGGSGVMPGVDLTSNRSVLDAMDEGVSLDALR